MLLREQGWDVVGLRRSPDAGEGDLMGLFGGGVFTEVRHDHFAPDQGEIHVTGNPTVSYIGLEPIYDELNAMDRVL